MVTEQLYISMYMPCEGQLGQRVPFVPHNSITCKTVQIFKHVVQTCFVEIKIILKHVWLFSLPMFHYAFKLWLFRHVYRMSHFTPLYQHRPISPLPLSHFTHGWVNFSPKIRFFLFINCRKLRTVPPPVYSSLCNLPYEPSCKPARKCNHLFYKKISEENRRTWNNVPLLPALPYSCNIPYVCPGLVWSYTVKNATCDMFMN